MGHVVESPWHGGCATAWFEAEIFCPFLLGRLALLVHEPLILQLARTEIAGFSERALQRMKAGGRGDQTPNLGYQKGALPSGISQGRLRASAPLPGAVPGRAAMPLAGGGAAGRAPRASPGGGAGRRGAGAEGSPAGRGRARAEPAPWRAGPGRAARVVLGFRRGGARLQPRSRPWGRELGEKGSGSFPGAALPGQRLKDRSVYGEVCACARGGEHRGQPAGSWGRDTCRCGLPSRWRLSEFGPEGRARGAAGVAFGPAAGTCCVRRSRGTRGEQPRSHASSARGIERFLSLFPAR